MADYEIVKPKVDLRKKIKVLPSGAKFDPVAKAEQAMERLSVNFGNWMRNETFKLQNAWDKTQKSGKSRESLDELFRCGHDIKGQAHTMGFPLAGLIAGSLCEMIERIEDPDEVPMELLEKHVQAINAVVKEDAREEDHAIAKQLATELINLTLSVLEQITPDNDPRKM